MIAARAIALICCLFACDVALPPVGGVSAAPLSAKLRLPGADRMEVDLIAALGRAWGEPELRDLLAALRIEGKPVVKRGDVTTFLQNYQLGIELTFRYAEGLDVPLRAYPADALVLTNIRLYGPSSRSRAAFTGELPFGLRFGDSKEILIAKLGPPDLDGSHVPPMRWDTARYALFASVEDAGLFRLSLQVPYVASRRPGFEER